MVGILIRNRIGMEIYGTNTGIEQVDLGEFEPGEELDIDFQFECWLTPQHYTVTVATQYAGRIEPRLAGRRAFLRSDFAAPGGGCDRSARADRVAEDSAQMKARLTLKVRAGARRTEFAGRYGDAWKLHVAAPPVDGKANRGDRPFPRAELAGVPAAAMCGFVSGSTGSTEDRRARRRRSRRLSNALFSNRMDLARIQEALRREKLDGWLFFDHHHTRPAGVSGARASCRRGTSRGAGIT